MLNVTKDGTQTLSFIQKPTTQRTVYDKNGFPSTINIHSIGDPNLFHGYMCVFESFSKWFAIVWKYYLSFVFRKA